MESKLSFRSFIPSLIVAIFFSLVYSCNSKKEVVETQIEYVYLQAEADVNTLVLRISDFQNQERSDREALQAMFDAVPDNALSATFDLQGKTFIVDGTIYYHKLFNRRTKIIGNNATIKATGDFDVLVEDKGYGFIVGNGKEDNDIMRWMDTFTISDVLFRGGRNQLRLVGTLQSRIQNCQFYGGYRGAQLIFCLQAVVDQSRFQFHKVEGLVLRAGVSDESLMSKWMGTDNPKHKEDGKYFENASGSNSQSNRSIVSDCRFYGGKDQFNLVRSQASDGIQIDNCIFEGHATKHSIYHDSRGSTTVKSFEVINPHLEHGKLGITESLIYAHGGAFIELVGIYSQYGGVCQIDADGKRVIVERPRWLPLRENSLKAGKSDSWQFKDCELKTEELADPKTWIDGKVPAQAIQETQTKFIGLNKFGMRFENVWTGAVISANNLGESTPHFIMLGDKDKGSDFEHNINRVIDWETTLTEKGSGDDLSNYKIAGTIPVYAYDANGKRRVVLWPYIEKK